MSIWKVTNRTTKIIQRGTKTWMIYYLIVYKQAKQRRSYPHQIWDLDHQPIMKQCGLFFPLHIMHHFQKCFDGRINGRIRKGSGTANYKLLKAKLDIIIANIIFYPNSEKLLSTLNSKISTNDRR